ncbi:uncharacterized protein [Periplaneta americana]|uniref:uncharacterized protein isoform X2 n=1 Tax=Periplaneta americana TaxID=6978 RepID=UPI0037E94BDF
MWKSKGSHSMYRIFVFEGLFVLSLFGISCVVWIITNLLLLYGAMLKQYKFLVPWICWHVVLLIGAIVEIAWTAPLVARQTVTNSFKDAGRALIACLIAWLCTLLYCWIVVYSFYRVLKEAEDKLAIAFSRRQYAATAPAEYTVPTEVAHVHAEAPPIPGSVIYNVQAEVPSSQRSQRHRLSHLPSNRHPSHYNRQHNASSNPHLQQLHWNMRRRDQPVDTESRRSSYDDYYSNSGEMMSY